MEKERSFVRRLAEGMDLPGESLPRQPLVELCGDRRVLIENHKGVIEYGTEKIQVRVKYGAVCIVGRGLRLCRMCGQQLVIAGNIDGVSIMRGRI